MSRFKYSHAFTFNTVPCDLFNFSFGVLVDSFHKLEVTGWTILGVIDFHVNINVEQSGWLLYSSVSATNTRTALSKRLNCTWSFFPRSVCHIMFARKYKASASMAGPKVYFYIYLGCNTFCYCGPCIWLKYIKTSKDSGWRIKWDDEMRLSLKTLMSRNSIYATGSSQPNK